jgi:hypothetical protein
MNDATHTTNNINAARKKQIEKKKFETQTHNTNSYKNSVIK